MAKIISGKELSAKLKADMAAQVAEFPEKYGRVPHLVVILVGDNPASVSYVTGKAKASERTRPYANLRLYLKKSCSLLYGNSMKTIPLTASSCSFRFRSISASPR